MWIRGAARASLFAAKGFGSSFYPELDKAQIFDLATCQFIEEARALASRGKSP